MVKSIFRFALTNLSRPWLIRISYWVRPLLEFYYSGSRYEDPIDARTYRKMLPYGYESSQRQNALAPGSLSLERHRLLWLYIREETNFFTAPQKVLHIAPEQCFYDRFRKMKNLNYHTADLDSPIADIKMDIHNIPFDDNTFDVVLCNHVLEHVNDDIQCISELYRVLKPNGWAIIQVPSNPKLNITEEDPSITDPKERTRRFGQYDHVRMYGKDYPQRLEKTGFKVKVTNYSEKLSSEQFNRYCLLKDEILYVCHK